MSKDKKYRVKALSCSGNTKKIHRNGDIVKASDFNEGHAATLAEKGFLEEIVEKAAAPKKKSIAEQLDDKQTSKELKKVLTDKGIKEDELKGMLKAGLVALVIKKLSKEEVSPGTL